MEHAVEQRQINQPHAFTSYQAAPATQSLPLLVNTFFAKNEALPAARQLERERGRRSRGLGG